MAKYIIPSYQRSFRNQLTVEAMSTEALTTSEIEGEILNRASVQSSIQKQLGLPTDNRKVGTAEHGISEMMINLQRREELRRRPRLVISWNSQRKARLQGRASVGTRATSSAFHSGPWRMFHLVSTESW
jgi:hypothetical protein